jgi:hypothetical protein
VIRDSAGLSEECLSAEQCLLVLRGKADFGKREEGVLTDVMRTYGGSTRVATLDSVLYELSIEARSVCAPCTCVLVCVCGVSVVRRSC